MRKLVIGMAMASTALSTPALAREGQWYIQGDGGVMIVEDQSLDVNGAAGDAGQAADHDAAADLDIVAHLADIVDLRARAHARGHLLLADVARNGV